jgi:outer membrane protein assembly factor BamE (lipoprotein component of BamABCDE complex)
MKLFFVAPLLSSIFLLSACAPSAPLAAIPARQVETQKITLGNVQMVVKKGATSADVLMALGSPNIVSSNKDGTETWVYDKIVAESQIAQGNRSQVTVTSTRTMMVVVKYDKSNRVEEVQYRQTSY